MSSNVIRISWERLYYQRSFLCSLYALKAEKWSKTVLKIEIGVLKATNARNSRHFCTLVDVVRVWSVVQGSVFRVGPSPTTCSS